MSIHGLPPLSSFKQGGSPSPQDLYAQLTALTSEVALAVRESPQQQTVLLSHVKNFLTSPIQTSANPLDFFLSHNWVRPQDTATATQAYHKAIQSLNHMDQDPNQALENLTDALREFKGALKFTRAGG